MSRIATVSRATLSRVAASLPIGIAGMIVIAGCAVGCGGSATHPKSASSPSLQATNRYIDALNAAQRDFAASVKPIRAAVAPTSSSGSDRGALRRLDLAVRALEARLNRIAAPPSVTSLHAILLSELAAYEREIQRTVRRLTAHRPGPVLAARRSLVRITHTAGTRIDATLRAINARLH